MGEKLRIHLTLYVVSLVFSSDVGFIGLYTFNFWAKNLVRCSMYLGFSLELRATSNLVHPSIVVGTSLLVLCFGGKIYEGLLGFLFTC